MEIENGIRYKVGKGNVNTAVHIVLSGLGVAEMPRCRDIDAGIAVEPIWIPTLCLA